MYSYLYSMNYLACIQIETGLMKGITIPRPSFLMPFISYFSPAEHCLSIMPPHRHQFPRISQQNRWVEAQNGALYPLVSSSVPTRSVCTGYNKALTWKSKHYTTTGRCEVRGSTPQECLGNASGHGPRGKVQGAFGAQYLFLFAPGFGIA